MHRMNLTFAAVSLAVVAGCTADSPPPPRFASATPVSASDATPRPAAATAVHSDTASPTSGSVHIDERILKACGNLPVAHFAFDSSRVEGEAAAALNALAGCFATGALRGHSMRLIGHTDPRGETEYNLALGQRRAGSVAGYISSHGVERAHINSSSRGEFDATGNDEDGWARDRKVDVFLAD